MADILIPVSPGELLDKITILRIKVARISDPGKLANVRRELSRLEQTWANVHSPDASLEAEAIALERVNTALWEVEDRLRENEARGDFGSGFVDLARSVYLHNDERAAIKRRINLALNSDIVEEKSYAPYRGP